MSHRMAGDLSIPSRLVIREWKDVGISNLVYKFLMTDMCNQRSIVECKMLKVRVTRLHKTET